MCCGGEGKIDTGARAAKDKCRLEFGHGYTKVDDTRNIHGRAAGG